MTINRLILGMLAALILFAAAPAQARDYHQCERRCHEEFGPEARGRKLNKRTCLCKDSDGKELGKIGRLWENDPPDLYPIEVCGIDGKTYPDEEAAKAVTTVLHIGPCGKCSTINDVELYRKMSQTLSKKSERCAYLMVFFGLKMARGCFEKMGFTEGCTDCWMLNMECSAVHCAKICMKTKLKGTPPTVNGELNDCYKCDETHCGGHFVRCAGANRRRAGVISDIPRPPDEVWPEEVAPIE